MVAPPMTSDALVERLRREAEAMHAATSGLELHDTFHAFNWSDKPHRVVFDAVRLIREAADRIESLEARLADEQQERLRASREVLDLRYKCGLGPDQKGSIQAAAAVLAAESETPAPDQEGE